MLYIDRHLGVDRGDLIGSPSDCRLIFEQMVEFSM